MSVVQQPVGRVGAAQGRDLRCVVKGQVGARSRPKHPNLALLEGKVDRRAYLTRHHQGFSDRNIIRGNMIDTLDSLLKKAGRSREH